MKKARLCFALALALSWVCNAAAEDLGFRGWGPRVGVSDDPDQFVAGAHFDLGEFAPHWRIQPSFDLGFGDDVFTFTGNLMSGYYFPLSESSLTPYAAGQVTVAWFDFDAPGYSESDVELGLGAVGGIELPLDGGTRFLAEIQIGIGDVPDFKLLVGWTF